jgi:hypothetical protein
MLVLVPVPILVINLVPVGAPVLSLMLVLSYASAKYCASAKYNASAKFSASVKSSASTRSKPTSTLNTLAVFSLTYWPIVVWLFAVCSIVTEPDRTFRECRSKLKCQA